MYVGKKYATVISELYILYVSLLYNTTVISAVNMKKDCGRTVIWANHFESEHYTVRTCVHVHTYTHMLVQYMYIIQSAHISNIHIKSTFVFLYHVQPGCG